MPADPHGYMTDLAKYGAGGGYYGWNYRATWDFAVQGGATGTIVLPTVIPANTVVFGGLFHVITTFAGATNTVAIGLNTTTDLLAATAIATYGTIGVHAVTPVFTAASAFVLTADRQLTLTLATAAVTAGKMTIYLALYPSEAAD